MLRRSRRIKGLSPGRQSGWVNLRRLAGISLLVGVVGCEQMQRIPPMWRQFPAPQTTPETVNAAQSAATGRMEQDVHQQINVIRQRQGFATLRYNDQLAQVARNYSRRMAEQRFFAHVSPQGDTLSDRVKAAGIFYFIVGENLFTSTNVPQPERAAVQGWMESPGHRENVLRAEFRETGIGVWRRGNTYYFTQLFMRSLSQ